MVVVCACVAGGCRGPLFVLGPFVLAGDGLRGGAFVWVLFAWFFHLWERSWLFSSFFGLVGSEGENVLFFWITARPHALFVCGGCLSVFVRFLGLSLFC